jgi:hypothetical protein
MTTATARTKTQVDTFKIKSPQNFIGFLKKFAMIKTGQDDSESGSLLLELTPDAMLAKSFTFDHATVKYSKMALIDVLEGTVKNDLIKIGLHNVSKVFNIFRQFDEGAEIFMDLKHEPIGEDEAAVGMTFRTNNLKISLGCQPINQFPIYISSDALKGIIKGMADQKVLEFGIDKGVFSKVKGLASMDGTELITLKISDGKIVFAGKTFEFQVKDAPAGSAPVELPFKADRFSFIDPEASEFHVGTDKVLVKSTESTTMIILGITT